MAAECPRCMAERRARWLRVAANICVVPTVALVGMLCLGRFSPQNEKTAFATLIPLVCLMGCVGPLAKHFTLIAATPLSLPPVDPLAPYRGGLLVECPRHPFGR